MNEFIVWDSRNKKFVSNNNETGREFFINCDGKVFLKTIGMETFGGNMQLEWEINRFKAFKDIGKTDIEGNKIYADSSIFEFEYKRNHPLEIWDKFMGIFRFNSESLHYWIDCSNGYKIGFGSNLKKIKNLKIIGTLQKKPELLEQQ